MYEPELVIKDEHRFTMFDFLRRMRKSNFGRFVAFIGFMNFSVQIAAPFFSVYMLRDLKFDYLTYAVINMTTPLTMVLMMGRWGARADHVGNIKVMRFTSLFIPFIPILWVVSPNVIYLICVQVFAGFFWAGFNLSSSNFIYDAVSPEKRIRCIAYFNVVNGVAIFSGATLGGYLVRFLPPFLGYRILTLLLISGILRFIARSVLIFVREVRGVKDVSSMQLFYSVISRKPLIAPAISERE
jgi:MFS family permease